MTFSHTASRALAAMAVTATAAVLPVANTASAEPVSCPQWTRHTVSAGYGILENLEFDGLDGPGAILVDGDTAYFTTGNTATAALTGRTDGTMGPERLVRRQFPRHGHKAHAAMTSQHLTTQDRTRAN